MMACQTCAHWGGEEDYWRDYTCNGLKVCSRIGEFFEASEWNDDGDRVMKPECRNDLAFAQDGSGYRAFVVTKPNFFCAHYEQKP